MIYHYILYIVYIIIILSVINCYKSHDDHPTGGVPKKMPSQDFIDEKTIGVVRQPSPVWN